MTDMGMAANQHSTRRLYAEAAERLKHVCVTGLRDGGEEMMTRVGIELTNMLKVMLSQPGTGHTYRSRGSSATHRASAPGQPPAPDLGEYRNSFRWDTGIDGRGPYVDVGTSDRRGPTLEFGTDSMAERPHFRPVMADVRDVIADKIDSVEATQRTIAGRLRAGTVE